MYRSFARSKVFVLCLLVAFSAGGSALAAGEDDERHTFKRAIIHELHGGHHSGTFLGVQLTELTAELRIHFGVPETIGVMVSKVIADTPAQRAGIQVGDIVTRVDGEDVSTARGLARAIQQREEGEVVDLEVWREKRIEILSPTLAKREVKRELNFRRRFDCGENADCKMEFDCGGDCDVKVTCANGDCECTVDGKVADCEQLPTYKHFRMRHRDHDE